MDTKLKKSKIITSYILHFTSLILIPFTIICGLYLFSAVQNYGTSGDYQNSQDFRDTICAHLETFISVATDNIIDTNKTNTSYPPSNDGFYDETLSENYIHKTVATEETATTASYSIEKDSYLSNELVEDYNYGAGSIASEETSEYTKSVINNINNCLYPDKNMLYLVCYNNKTLYTNAEDMDIDLKNSDFSLHAYNFLLKFDGQKVSIIKDGNAISVYESEYYTGDSLWYVPGYKNLITDDNIKNVTVYLAAAKNPVLYSNIGYVNEPADRNYIPDNSFYYINNKVLLIRLGIKLFITLALITLALTIVARLTRKYRIVGNQKIAEFMGKFVFELRLIAIFVLFVSIILFVSIALNIIIGWYETEIAFLIVLFSFYICCYILYNDFKYNRPLLKNSLIYKIYEASSAKNLSLSVSERIVRRFRYITGIWILILLCIAVFMLAVLFEFDFEGIIIDFFILFITIGISWPYITILKQNKQLALDLLTLNNQINAIYEGNYSDRTNIINNSDLNEMSKKLDDIQNGMKNAINDQIKSERMKIELITNVSHDLKTPLTSIISYVELLKKESDLPDYVKDYIKILDEKSIRLNNMVQDIFTVSKATSGELLVNITELDFVKLIQQTLADMGEHIENSSYVVKTSLPSTPVIINTDGDRMYRVFQNLLQNALKYSLEGSRIYITLDVTDTLAVASIKNTSAKELDDTIDFTERFVRGDSSRSDGGSGLGLSIARSFTENCGGTFELTTNADLFIVTITFKIK